MSERRKFSPLNTGEGKTHRINHDQVPNRAESGLNRGADLSARIREGMTAYRAVIEQIANIPDVPEDTN